MVCWKNNKIYSCCGKNIYIWDYDQQTDPLNVNGKLISYKKAKIIEINLENKFFSQKINYRKRLNSLRDSKELPINIKHSIANKNSNKYNNNILLKGSELRNQVYNFVFINDNEILFTLYYGNNAFILNIKTGKIRSRLPEEQIDYSVITNPKVFKNKYYLTGVKDKYDIVLVFLDNKLAIS